MEHEEQKKSEIFILCNATKDTNETLGELIKKFNEKKMNDQDKKAIQEFIKQRLTERYITPFPQDYHTKENDPQYGFLIMASMCLLIETIQAFKEGKSKFKQNEVSKAFKNFFKQEQEIFRLSTKVAKDFYSNVRCGILHQGEVGYYWKISSLQEENIIKVEADTKTINAPRFLEGMKTVLDKYIQSLANNENLFDNCIKKISAIIQNCTQKLK